MSKLIATTLNVFEIEKISERRDSIDQEWMGIFNNLNYKPLLIPNKLEKITEYLDSFPIDGLLITGGNNLDASGSQDAPERESQERKLIDYFLKKDLPILGVCRGMQLLNVYFGGSLKPVTNHVRVFHKLETNEHFEQDFEVNSYHNFGIGKDELAKDLKPFAINPPDKIIEGFKHSEKNVFGIMWHPEREPLLKQENLGFFSKVFGD